MLSSSVSVRPNLLVFPTQCLGWLFLDYTQSIRSCEETNLTLMYPFKIHVSDSGYLLSHSLHSYTTHYKGLVCVQNSQHMCIMCAIDTFIPAMQLFDKLEGAS